MIKKAIIGTGVLLVLAALVFGTHAVSYVRTSARCVGDAVQDSVPIGFQIERARDMIEDLVPEIRENLHLIAKEQVVLEGLEKEISEGEGSLTKAEDEMARLSGDLKTGKDVFQYAGHTYTVGQVKTDLANRLERCKTAKATLETKRQVYEARLKKLDAARAKLDGMLAEKRKLQVEVENLEARLEMLAAAQTTSDYKLDDSKLAQAKQLVSDLKTRLDVAEKMVDADGQLQGEIQLEEPAPENIVEKVAEYFGEKPAVAGETPEVPEVAEVAQH
jgi:chromosome segregation ATPase